MTNKATTKPAPIKPATTTKTTTRSKYYKGLDIFFYIMYICCVLVILYSLYKIFIDKDTSDHDKEFYGGLILILLKVTSFLTFILIALAFTTKYIVMYTIIHHKLFKTSEK